MAGLSSPSITSRRHPPPPPKHERRPSANSAATASTNGQTTRHGSSVRSRASSRSRQPHSEDARHGSSNTSNSISTTPAGNLKDSGSKCSQSDRSLNRNRSRPRHRPSVESGSAGGSHGGGRDRSSSIGPRNRSRAGGGGNAAVGSGAIGSSSRVRGGREKEKDDNSSKKHQFATPFDNKGRCHYHSHMQLAKKKLTGGWKVLLDRCPQCIDEEKNDDKSVRSSKSNRSTRSRRSAKSSTDRGVRRSNTTGSGGSSLELRHRHQHQHYHHHSHNHYLHKVPSSPSSSTGNLPPPPPPPKQLQNQSNGNAKKLPSIKKYTPKFQCPFDDQGYCHQHSHIRLAKKKLTGGWRILQEYCLECQREEAEEQSAMNDCRSVGSRGSRRSRRSRVSVGGSTNGGRSEVGETSTEMSTSQSEVIRKKIVKKMKYTDENGDDGLYTGYVNGQYKPHGRGKMVYNNGLRYDGTWNEGTKVHGKTTRGKSSSGKSKSVRKSPESGGAGHEKESDGGSGNDAGGGTTSTTARPTLKEYRDLYKSAVAVPDDIEKQTVKNMKFIDFYGDPGRYTGEVNDQKMPHGMGQMTYDHGLVQEGNWTNGILDEGSIISMPKNEARSKTSSSRVRDP
mmetsp:Transcript_26312/g.53356  ORF Transcript_26312/g.53356 Transcript_26312/m.53356 type:complete len:619 (-) Transcript_26312:283-2139(-)